ncbi:MAG: polysaccharide biosynthesis C-terminal domain-containing protein, partial [Chloroflexota bacterium]|nr:polysaccharide biosynthesis C-terminal domain-containing protein [Chloroflexota bacterium]
LIGMLGLNSAVFFQFRRIDDLDRRRTMAGSAVLMALGASAVVGAAGVLASAPVAAAVLRDRGYAPAVALAFVGLPLTVGASMAMDLLRLEFRPVAFSVLGIGRSVAANAIGVILVVFYGWGVAGMVGAQAALSGVALIVGLWLTRRSWTAALDRRVVMRMLAFGLPLVPAGLAYWVMSYSDRFFVVQFRGLQDAGIYAMANKIAQVVQLAVFAFSTAWWPFAYAEAARDPNHRVLFARVFTAAAVGLSLIAVALGLLARELLIVATTPAFVAAYAYVGILGFALAVNGLYQVVSIGVALADRTWHTAWTSGVAALVNVILNLVLIPMLGIAGAAGSTLVAYSVSAVLVYRVAQRTYPIPYQRRTPLIVMTAALAILLGGLFLDSRVGGTMVSAPITAAKLVGLTAIALLGLRLMRLSPRTLALKVIALRHGTTGP